MLNLKKLGIDKRTKTYTGLIWVEKRKVGTPEELLWTMAYEPDEISYRDQQMLYVTFSAHITYNSNDYAYPFSELDVITKMGRKIRDLKGTDNYYIHGDEISELHLNKNIAVFNDTIQFDTFSCVSIEQYWTFLKDYGSFILSNESVFKKEYVFYEVDKDRVEFTS